MYYQVYNKVTGQTLITCPDFQSAQDMLSVMNQPELRIRPVSPRESGS